LRYELARIDGAVTTVEAESQVIEIVLSTASVGTNVLPLDEYALSPASDAIM
jgi:hypothetical protein